MSFIPTISSLVSPLRRLLGLSPSSKDASPSLPFQDTSISACEQVFQARAILKSLGLPTELVLVILDYAEYWPSFEYSVQVPRGLEARAHHRIASPANIVFEADLFNNPVYKEIIDSGERCKIRSVEFDVVSCDQGWTSEDTTGTFSTSSWTEVSIVRDKSGRPDSLQGLSRHQNRNASLAAFQKWLSENTDAWQLVKRPESASMGAQDGEDPLAWYLQGNRVAAEMTEYRVVWTENDSQGKEGSGTGEGFIRTLREGDRILVWARAKYPGWQCDVQRVKITVRYGF